MSSYYCNYFELSNFEHKFIKRFADSRRNLRKSTIYNEKKHFLLFVYSSLLSEVFFLCLRPLTSEFITLRLMPSRAFVSSARGW